LAANWAAFREIGLKSVGTIMFIDVGIFVSIQKKAKKSENKNRQIT
jgi:hypothetical protein